MQVLRSALILYLTCYAGLAFCQGSKRSQGTPEIYFPKAVLVQLRSEKRKIDYFKKAGDGKEVEQVEKDVQGVNDAMVSDFRDNFNLCPYYFFVDTNIELIKEKKFDGVLLASDMKPATNLVVNEKSKDYYIIYYGQPEQETIGQNGEMASRTLFGAGLVVTDYTYTQLHRPVFFYVYNNRGYYGFHSKKGKYSYSSKKYNIEYYPLAGELLDKVHDHFRK